MSSSYSSFWDQFTTYQTELISLLVTLLITGGITFLFYPAILVHYHQAIEHSTKILRKPALKEQQKQEDDKDKDNDSSLSTPVLLSLVIPAYNEEDRLTVMLDECYEYLSKLEQCPSLKILKEAYQQQVHHHHDNDDNNNNNNNAAKLDHTSILVEWIVINDGSSDQTCKVFETYVKQVQKKEEEEADSKPNPLPFVWKLVTLPINEGKGAAVQVGMTDAATGYYRLMVDADGATTFGQGLEAVSQELLRSSTISSGKADDNQQQQQQQQQQHQHQPTIVFGSRAGENASAKRSALRQFLMHSFLWLRSCVVGTPISLRDTQCGFKLFDQACAQQLFSNLHLRRWAFDIELVYVALNMQMIIKEVTVPWHEVDGSKLNTGFLPLIRVSIGMLRDMCCVRACYVLGIWQIHNKKKNKNQNNQHLSSTSTSTQQQQQPPPQVEQPKQ